MTASPDTDWLDVLKRTLTAAPKTWPAMVTEHAGIDLAKAFYDAWRPQGARLIAMVTPISDPELAELERLRDAAPREPLDCADVLNGPIGGRLKDGAYTFYKAAYAAIPKLSVRITALLATCATLQRDCDAKDGEIARLRSVNSFDKRFARLAKERAEHAESALAKLSSRPMPAQLSDESLELMERDAESFSCSDHLRGLIAKYRDLRAWAAEITNASEGVAAQSDEQSPEQKAAILPREPAPGSTKSDAAREEDRFDFSSWDDEDCTLCNQFEKIAERCAAAINYPNALGTIYGAMESAASLVYEHHVARRATSPDDAVAAVERLPFPVCPSGRGGTYEDGYGTGVEVATTRILEAIRTLPSTKPSPSDLIRRLDHLLHDMCDEGSADDCWHAEQAHALIHAAAAHLAPEPEIRECARKEAAERKEAIEALRQVPILRAALQPFAEEMWENGEEMQSSACQEENTLVHANGDLTFGDFRRAAAALYAAPPKPEPAPRSVIQSSGSDWPDASSRDLQLPCHHGVYGICDICDAVPRSAAWPTEEDVERALHATVPGGAEVWCFLPQKDAFTPHETARNVMRAALSAIAPPAREAGR